MVFLFSLKSFFTKHALEANAEDQSASLTEISEARTYTQLSIEDVNSVLLTEVKAEYGTHRLLSKESHDLWAAAIDYEWSRAREVESSMSKNLGSLRRATEFRGTFPYLVCDTEKGKSGERCRSTVEQHFGEDIMASWITQDGMCDLSPCSCHLNVSFLLVGNISQCVITSIRHAILSAHLLQWPKPHKIFWR